MVVVLLIAAFLRLYGLNNGSPPGLEHDEVAHWLINQEILDGNHSIYFSGAYGHEAGYHYLQSAFMVLLGDNALALRLPSAFLGLLVVAVSFALARRLFGLKAAVLSSSLLAVLFWPVFYSRLGLRAISLPLLSGLSAYFWWKGWGYRSADDRLTDEQKKRLEAKSSSQSESSKRVLWYFALAGLLAGLLLHYLSCCCCASGAVSGGKSRGGVQVKRDQPAIKFAAGWQYTSRPRKHSKCYSYVRYPRRSPMETECRLSTGIRADLSHLLLHWIGDKHN